MKGKRFAEIIIYYQFKCLAHKKGVSYEGRTLHVRPKKEPAAVRQLNVTITPHRHAVQK